jgi:hypothetical protein
MFNNTVILQKEFAQLRYRQAFLILFFNFLWNLQSDCILLETIKNISYENDYYKFDAADRRGKQCTNK